MFDFFCSLLRLIVSDSDLNLDGVTKVLIHVIFLIRCVLDCLKLFSFGAVVSHGKCQPSAGGANEGGDDSFTFFSVAKISAQDFKHTSLQQQPRLKMRFQDDTWTDY